MYILSFTIDFLLPTYIITIINYLNFKRSLTFIFNIISLSRKCENYYSNRSSEITHIHEYTIYLH